MYKGYEIKLNAILDKHGVQKVELTVASDIQKQIGKIKSERKNIDKATKAFKKAADNALDAREAGVDTFQRAMAIREDAIEGARALGIKPEEIKGFKELDDTSDLLNKEYQNLLKML